jgi:hypothetical protein
VKLVLVRYPKFDPCLFASELIYVAEILGENVTGLVLANGQVPGVTARRNGRLIG